MIGYAGPGQDKDICKSTTAAAMALQAACGRIIKLKTDTPQCNDPYKQPPGLHKNRPPQKFNPYAKEKQLYALTKPDTGGSGDKEKGDPSMTGYVGLRSWKMAMCKKPTAVASAAAGPLPWPSGPHVAGY